MRGVARQRRKNGVTQGFAGGLGWLIKPSALGVLALFNSGFVAPQSSGERAWTGKGAAPVGMRVLRPELSTPGHEAAHKAYRSDEATVQVDALSGSPRVMTGRLTNEFSLVAPKIDAQTLQDKARKYLEKNAAIFGVAASDVELDQKALLIDEDVQFLKYRVRRSGVLVRDAAIDFRFKNGHLVQVANQSFAEASIDERPKRDGLDEAATSAVAMGSLVREGRELFRVVAEAESYRLVKVQEFEVKDANQRLFHVEVEQATGDVFEVRPTEFYVDGTARGEVYPRFYRDEVEVVPYRDLHLYHPQGRVTTDADGRIGEVPEDEVPKMRGFEGYYVKVVPQSGSRPQIPATRGVDAAWNIVFDENYNSSEDKSMAQSMAYAHLNKIIHHSKQYIKASWFNDQLVANVNHSETCNAYWDGYSVNFFASGDGCANTALISDIMYHEWGHGLDHHTGGVEDDAFSEGFGDILSMIMTRSPIVGKGFFLSRSEPIRNLEDLKVYPRDAHQECHDEGLIIGGAFWDLYQELSKTHDEDEVVDLLSKYALKGVYAASKYTDVYDALMVIDAKKDGDVGNPPNFCAINRAFARHGLAKADRSCR